MNKPGQVTSRPEKGYLLVSQAPGKGIVHRLCGPTDTGGAECPNCRKRLLTIAQFDASDTRLQIDTVGMQSLPLLFCWTCVISQQEFVYECSHDGREITLLRWARGESFRDFPYEGYPEGFPPEQITLKPLEPHKQEVIIKLNAGAQVWELAQEYPELSVPQHQVGGEPLLLQAIPIRSCPKCFDSMPLFASFGDSASSGHKFTGNEFVQTVFSLCRKCRVVHCLQMTD